jgi:hypothetical protein
MRCAEVSQGAAHKATEAAWETLTHLQVRKLEERKRWRRCGILWRACELGLAAWLIGSASLAGLGLLMVTDEKLSLRGVWPLPAFYQLAHLRPMGWRRRVMGDAMHAIKMLPMQRRQ